MRYLSSLLRLRWRTGLAAASAAVLLVACGGGGTDTTATSGPEGATVGTVTGFGSIVVDGVRYDDRSARVSIDTVAGAPDDGGNAELKLGQRVELRYRGLEDNSHASDVSISAEIVGPVTAISPDLVVAGQTIKINTDPAAGPVTVFDGFASAADIQIGQRVEVHGSAIDASTVLATRIERKPSLATWVRVTGNLSDLASDGSSFTLGGLTVLVNTSTRISPVGATLVNGKRVTVWSNTAPAGGTITAAFIRVKQPLPDALKEMRLAGAVSDCTPPCAASFKVGGLTIDASSARFSHGSAADLADGQWVELRGRVDAATGVFVATEVRFRQRDDERNDVRLIGAVTDFVDMGHFMVRGVAVGTDASTRFGPLCPATFSNGTLVAIWGSITNANVLAKRVECFSAMDGVTVEAKGTVASIDAPNQSFTLGGTLLGNLTLRWTDTTVFDAGKSGADIVVGAKLEVRGVVDGGVMTLTRVHFEDDQVNPAPGVAAFETQGIASGVSANGLTVNGLAISITGLTVIDLRDGPLVDGAKVKVLFVKEGSVNRALYVRTDN
jgi:hypothetical protein